MQYLIKFFGAPTALSKLFPFPNIKVSLAGKNQSLPFTVRSWVFVYSRVKAGVKTNLNHIKQLKLTLRSFVIPAKNKKSTHLIAMPNYLLLLPLDTHTTLTPISSKKNPLKIS